jgi:TnpA family transposase
MEQKTNKRRELLTGAQRVQLLALPTGLRELEERYSFTPGDLEFIGAHRTDSNRLGIAVQPCFLRYPGWAWTPEESILGSMLRWIAAQVSADPGAFESYAKRDPTRREHFLELLQEYSWRSFGLREYRETSAWLMNQARSTDLGMALITLL